VILVEPLPSSQLERLFPGDSEMARRMRALDWSATDFGPPKTWPENLRAAVSICLPCPFPMLLWWGRNLSILYNDAYLPWLTEAKHPRVLGRPAIECWPEIWDVIGPMLEGVLATGKATWSENSELYFNRRLPKEEVYCTWTFAPILAVDGQTVDGIFCPCTETTEQVVGARRLETLRKLGIRAQETRTVEAACQHAAAVLSENPRDIPFAAIYLVDAGATEATISAAVIPEGEHLLPAQCRSPVTLRSPLGRWLLCFGPNLRWKSGTSSLLAFAFRVKRGPSWWRRQWCSRSTLLRRLWPGFW